MFISVLFLKQFLQKNNPLMVMGGGCGYYLFETIFLFVFRPAPPHELLVLGLLGPAKGQAAAPNTGLSPAPDRLL